MSGPGRITRLIPRPVAVTIAARVYPVWEARLRDVATLQQWVDDRQPDVTVPMLETISTLPPGPTRDRVLLEAYARAEQADEQLYDAPDSPLYTTPAGVLFVVKLMLSRGTPDITSEDVAALLVGDAPATPAELGKARRVFWGCDTCRFIENILDFPRPHGGGSVSWAEAIDSVARSHHWTYDTIYDLSLSEFLNARRNGAAPLSGFSFDPAHYEATRRRIKRAWGEADDAPAPVEVGGGGPVWVQPATRSNGVNGRG